MNAFDNLCVRWTVGDVSDRGLEALGLSLWGAWRLFGPGARYVVCVNTLSPVQALEKTGPVPEPVTWHDNTCEIPEFIRKRMAPGMAEGVGWKLGPLRMMPDRFELSLDNDLVLWELPESLQRWLSEPGQRACIMARDIRRMLGKFEDLCPPGAWNSGIRGLPPGFDLESAFHHILAVSDEELPAGVQESTEPGEPKVCLSSELDEQGMQTAALSRENPLAAVHLDEVTVCSPFWPHLPHLGRCGAHFVGLNARHIPWDYYDRPADQWMTEHWNKYRPELYRLTGAPYGPAR